MSGRDWMLVLTLQRGVLTSSNMSSHARVCQRSVPLNIPASSSLVSVARLRHLDPSPSFTLAIPDIQHVWILSINGCQQTKSALLLYSEVHSFIRLFHKCVLRTPAWGVGGRETDHNAGLAIKAAKVHEQIITVIRRVCDNRGRYRNVWIQEK